MGFEEKSVESAGVFVDETDVTRQFNSVAEDIAGDLAFGSLRVSERKRRELFVALESKVSDLCEAWGPDDD